MSDMKYKAKEAMLKKLKETMGEMGAENVMGGMGVTVEAEDKEGLLEGLEKAEEVIENPEEVLEDAEVMEDSEMDYEEYSKEELIEMLKNR
jgi:hypothetical protein